MIGAILLTAVILMGQGVSFNVNYFNDMNKPVKSVVVSGVIIDSWGEIYTFNKEIKVYISPYSYANITVNTGVVVKHAGPILIKYSIIPVTIEGEGAPKSFTKIMWVSVRGDKSILNVLYFKLNAKFHGKNYAQPPPITKYGDYLVAVVTVTKPKTYEFRPCYVVATLDGKVVDREYFCGYMVAFLTIKPSKDKFDGGLHTITIFVEDDPKAKATFKVRIGQPKINIEINDISGYFIASTGLLIAGLALNRYLRA